MAPPRPDCSVLLLPLSVLRPLLVRLLIRCRPCCFCCCCCCFSPCFCLVCCPSAGFLLFFLLLSVLVVLSPPSPLTTTLGGAATNCWLPQVSSEDGVWLASSSRDDVERCPKLWLVGSDTTPSSAPLWLWLWLWLLVDLSEGVEDCRRRLKKVALILVARSAAMAGKRGRGGRFPLPDGGERLMVGRMRKCVYFYLVNGGEDREMGMQRPWVIIRALEIDAHVAQRGLSSQSTDGALGQDSRHLRAE